MTKEYCEKCGAEILYIEEDIEYYYGRLDGKKKKSFYLRGKCPNRKHWWDGHTNWKSHDGDYGCTGKILKDLE